MSIHEDYRVTVPIMNDPGMEKFGGLEKVLSELRALGAKRVMPCLDHHEANAAQCCKRQSWARLGDKKR